VRRKEESRKNFHWRIFCIFFNFEFWALRLNTNKIT
jgi:hypothetical protein